MSPPAEYLCPLTLDIMSSPVSSRWGHTYERCAILEWLDTQNCCPLTRKPLRHSDLISNTKLRVEIQKWKIASGYNFRMRISLDDPPSEFICPLSKKIMRSPVMSREGHNFDRVSIVEWCQSGHDFCPFSGKPLKLSRLIPNAALTAKIQNWMKLRRKTSKYEMAHDRCCADDETENDNVYFNGLFFTV